MIKKLKVNDEFESKMECFEVFKDFIRKEAFDLIDDNIDDVPLYKVNELIEDDVGVNIINEKRDKRARKYMLSNNKEIYLQDSLVYEEMDFFIEEDYSFLFMQDNGKYIFLGLYKYIEHNVDDHIMKWRRQKIEEISLNEIEIKKLIEKFNVDDMKLDKDSRFIIEKFNHDRIKKYFDDKEKLKEILKKHGAIYQFLPEELKNDEELAIIALDSCFLTEDIGKYIPKRFLNSMNFAKKVFSRDVRGEELKYFSDEIRNNLEICKMASVNGYPYMSENIRKNKEFALEMGDFFQRIDYMDKSLKKDKDIVKAYWRDVKDYIYGDFTDLLCLCSVISVDHFGNEIIDQFLEIEKTRHSKERIDNYEEKIDSTQFVKFKEWQNDEEPFVNMIDFDKEIFDEELYPVIVLIGEKENILSREIKEEYEEHCMIEIYTQDIDTDKFKLITKDTNKIMNLLRMITYTNSSIDDVMSEHYRGLLDMREILCNDIKKGNIEIYQWEGKLEEIKQTINQIPENFVDKNCMIQIVGNDELDAYICASIWSRIFGKKLFFEDVRVLCFAYL